ncbi:hypothetical protein [Cellulomonas shaoxiangyii]|uniref:Uncharacterized protein n=1 Tax=Cellulomonas shaoxiangyii TaxID=2566013 RepID=A0A4V1CN08_9CELL|nr:hypothetical protein [Cellulomonas shaoxiangyii]QCB94795.1 hypothetical protein E5225_15735 [Cellulomonas shaoxiangyii]TGY86525.1 hypothetical protein E5226_01760 [Cellulomonas shaoxiangyii]
MESSPNATPADAQAALRRLDDARERLAERITSPWWYRLGAAACTASMFVGAGLIVGRPASGSSAESASMMLIVLGAIVAPMVLLWALRRSTGMSVERYAEGMGTWYAVVFGLFAVGFVLQAFAGVPWAMTVAGVGAAVATVVRERSLDGLLRRRVRAGHDVRARA